MGGVRDSRPSEHVAECKGVVRAPEHCQSVARASPIAIAWTERGQSVGRASPIVRASPEHRQSVTRARERSQNVAKASPERYKTVARASLVKSQSSRRRAPNHSARGGRRAAGARQSGLREKTDRGREGEIERERERATIKVLRDRISLKIQRKFTSLDLCHTCGLWFPSKSLSKRHLDVSKRQLDSTWLFELASQRHVDSTWPSKVASKRHLDSIGPRRLTSKCHLNAR